MGLATLLARRSLAQRPGRTLFSILGIALGIATVVAVVTLDHNTIRGLTRFGADRPDVEVRPGGDSVASARELASMDGVAVAASYFQNDAVARVVPEEGRPLARGEGSRRVRLFALDARSYPELGVHQLVAGRDLDPATAAGEVLVGESLAERLGLELEDTLVLARPRRSARTACVEGETVAVGPARPDEPIERGFSIVGILGRESLGARSRGDVVLVDFEAGKELYAGAHIAPAFWVKRDPGVDVERLRASLGASHSYELNRSVLRGQAADERAFRTGVRMAGLLALLLGLYVIFHTLSMSLVERVAEVGTLAALGATRAQIGRVFLVEALGLAGAGCAAGVLLGALLAFGLQSSGITTLGTGKYLPDFELPFESVLPLAALGFLIALAGSVYPILVLRAASTVQALRGEESLRASGVSRGFHVFVAVLLVLVLPGLYFVIVPVVGEFSGQLVTVLLSTVALLALLVVLSFLMPSVLGWLCAALTRPFERLWPLAGRLAARTMQKSPTRVAVSASAIALVSASFVGLKGLTTSLRGEVEVWAQEAALDKVWVKDLPESSFAALEEHLASFPGILGLEKGNLRTHALFLLIGTDPHQLGRYGPIAEQPGLLRQMTEQHGIVLSRRLARESGYAVDDPVYVTKADGDVQEFRVAAISDAYGYFPDPDERLYGVIAEEYVRRYFCLDPDLVTDFAVRLDEGAGAGVVEAAVRDFAPGAEALRFEEGAVLLARHVDDIDRDFVLFDILIALTAVLAALGVLNGQLLAALERAKEIGVLKALGVTRRQVAGMVLLEALVIGLVGGGLGVLIGAVMTPMAVHALQELAGLALPQPGATPALAWAFAGASLLTLLAALYPIWRMNRLDPVRAVRTG